MAALKIFCYALGLMAGLIVAGFLRLLILINFGV